MRAPRKTVPAPLRRRRTVFGLDAPRSIIRADLLPINNTSKDKGD
jgi:hypothetical protein